VFRSASKLRFVINWLELALAIYCYGVNLVGESTSVCFELLIYLDFSFYSVN
jgi:hypothetical protein